MVRITVWKINFTFTCFNNLISVYRWPLSIWHIIGGFGRAPSWTPPSRAYAPPVFRKGQCPRVDTLSGCGQYFWERKKHTLRYYQLQMYISTNTHAFPLIWFIFIKMSTLRNYVCYDPEIVEDNIILTEMQCCNFEWSTFLSFSLLPVQRSYVFGDSNHRSSGASSPQQPHIELQPVPLSRPSSR